MRDEQATYGIESHGNVVAHMTPAEQRAPTLAESVRWLRPRPPMPAEVLDEIERASKETRALPARISDIEGGTPRPPARRRGTKQATLRARRR